MVYGEKGRQLYDGQTTGICNGRTDRGQVMSYRVEQWSIFSNGGHTFRQIKTPDTILDLDTLKNIWAKFGLNPFSSFSGEDFLKR